MSYRRNAGGLGAGLPDLSEALRRLRQQEADYRRAAALARMSPADRAWVLRVAAEQEAREEAEWREATGPAVSAARARARAANQKATETQARLKVSLRNLEDCKKKLAAWKEYARACKAKAAAPGVSLAPGQRAPARVPGVTPSSQAFLAIPRQGARGTGPVGAVGQTSYFSFTA